MSVSHVSPLLVQALEELLPRRAGILRLLAGVDAEIVALGGTIPTATNTCGHPNATPAVIGPKGSECSACALKRLRAEDAARETRTEYAAHFKLLPGAEHDLADCQIGASR